MHRSRRPGAARAEPLEARMLLSAQLVRDINTTPIPSSSALPFGAHIGEMVDLNGTLLFAAYDGIHGGALGGLELFRSDGTAAGTTLVKDIYPGGGSRPRGFVRADDKVFFIAEDPAHGSELWVTDGTDAGTRPLDLSGGPASTQTTSHVAVGDSLYFVARTEGTSIWDLWKSDGTREGTVRLTTNGGGGTVFPFRGSLVFVGIDGLWRTDGTPAGTVPFGPLPPVQMSVPAVVNDLIVFQALNSAAGVPDLELWATDGTPGGARKLVTIREDWGYSFPSITTQLVVGDTLYFVTEDRVAGQELWATDGTADGTRLVKDIEPGTAHSGPTDFTEMGGVLYFTAGNAASGRELWRSDGTAAGTTIVREIAAGTSSSGPVGLAAVGDTLYFGVSNPNSIRGLWKSDGTSAGTVMLRRFIDTGFELLPRITVSDDMVYFLANDGTGAAIWKTDGTPAGTVLAADPNTVTRGSSPALLGRLGDVALFAADDGVHDMELWKTDGTAAGTSLLKDINTAFNGFPGVDGSTPRLVIGDTMYFVGQHFQSGKELWKTDGTPAGTMMVANLEPTSSSSNPSNFVEYNGLLYFRRGGSFPSLYRSDGTAAGTTLVHAGDVSLVGEMGGRLIFVKAGDLWSTDGTQAGTSLIRDFNPGGSPVGIESPVVRVGNALMFFANDGGGNKLFRSDGTAAGTVPVVDLLPNGNDWYTTDGMAAAGAKLYFNRNTGTGFELWTSDGTAAGTRLVMPYPPASTPANSFYDLDGTALFTVPDGNGFRSLFRTDGTPGGTSRAAAGSFDTVTYARAGERLYLGGMTWADVDELKGPGLAPVHLAATGPTVGPPLLMPDGSLLFVKDDPRYGRELWRYQDDGLVPAVQSARFEPGGGATPQSISFRLSQDVAPDPTVREHLVLTESATGAVIPAHLVTRSYEPATQTITFTFPRLAGGRLAGGEYRAVLPAGSVSAADGDTLADDYVLDFTAPPAEPMAGPFLFYDGGRAGGAIDQSKRSLRPGEQSSFANLSNYHRGINGIVIDLAPLSRDYAPTHSDFQLRLRQAGDAPFALTIPPHQVEFLRGGGAGGTDRVILKIPDHSAMNGWLELRVFGSVATGLTSDRTVYFASLPGDTGDTAPGTIPAVTAADISRTRAHLGARDADSLSRYDFNRDGRIDARDYGIVRANLFNQLGGLPGVTETPAASSAQPGGAPPTTATRPTRRTMWDHSATALLTSVFAG